MWDFWHNWRKPAAEKRQEALNAYLDGALSPRQQQEMEAELAQDEILRAELAQLRLVRERLRQLPRRRAPRNFTLDPALYGRPQRQPLVQAYPVLRVATVLTAFFFVLAIALQTFSPPRAMVFTAAEPAALPAEQVALEVAPLAAEMEIVEATRLVTETVVETLVESAPRAGAASEMPAATPAAESAADTAAPPAPASVELPATPESDLAAYPAPAVAATSAPTWTPDSPRLAEETEIARAGSLVAGEEEKGETAVLPATPAPETQVSTQFPDIPWLTVSLGALLALLITLTLIARRRLL